MTYLNKYPPMTTAADVERRKREDCYVDWLKNQGVPSGLILDITEDDPMGFENPTFEADYQDDVKHGAIR